MEKQLRRLAEECGVDSAIAEEISCYVRNPYQRNPGMSDFVCPPAEEPHVAVWREYAEEAKQQGVFETLRRRLVQLQFPVKEGISASPDYRAATLKGKSAAGMGEASGLLLLQPQQLKLMIRESLAGAIPVLIPCGREDFVLLLQALSKRNEPQPVSPSQGAAMIMGYNNWDRMNRLKEAWQSKHPGDILGWAEEFRRIAADKSLYQDRFTMISDGYYSAVPPERMELPESEWRDVSISLRLEHECTHYFTYRFLVPDGKSLLDEIIADYMAISSASGRFRADWLLRFLGLAEFPQYDCQGRLAIYCQQDELSGEGFRLLQYCIVKAAELLQRFSGECRSANRQERIAELITIAGCSLVQLADEGALPDMLKTYQTFLAD